MIEIEATLDQNRKCIFVDGDGQADIRFTTDATQLAKVLSALAEFKGQRFLLTLSKVEDDGRAEEKSSGRSGKKHSAGF